MRDPLRLVLFGAKSEELNALENRERIEVVQTSTPHVLPIVCSARGDAMTQTSNWRPQIVSIAKSSAHRGERPRDPASLAAIPEPSEDAIGALLQQHRTARRWVRGLIVHAAANVARIDQLVDHFDFAMCLPPETAPHAVTHFSLSFAAAVWRQEIVADALSEALGACGAAPGLARLDIRFASGIDALRYRIHDVSMKPVVAVHHCRIDWDSGVELTAALRPYRHKLQLLECDRHRGTRSQVEEADIVIALVSADAMSDDDWFAVTERALARHDSGIATVVPLFVRHCLVEGRLAEIAALNLAGEPLPAARAARKAAVRSACRAVLAIVEQMQGDLEARRREERLLNARARALLART